MGSSTNGAGSNPTITHPPGASASGNSAPTNVIQINGLEGATKALKESSEINRLLLACSAAGGLLALGLASAAIAFCITASARQEQAIINAAQIHQDAVREFSEWSAKTYNREVAIDADALLMGTDYRRKFGEIPIPPNLKSKRKGH